MLDRIPDKEELIGILGESLYSVWCRLCSALDEKYDMERLWNNGGKAWLYEYKYRRGGKTLCSLYAREHEMGFMIIFGKKEREKFETQREDYSDEVQRYYDDAETYHDGKWVMFFPKDAAYFDDYLKMLEIKRKPNKKADKE